MRFPSLAALVVVALGCGLPTEGLTTTEGGSSTGTGASTGTGGATGNGGDGAGAGNGGGAGATGGAGGSSPTCEGGLACIPTVAGGAYVYVLPGDVACPAGADTPTPNVEQAVDPGCTACACGAPQGGSCAANTVHIREDCGSGQEASTATTDGDCIDVVSGPSHSVLGAWEDPPIVTSGSCSPQTSTKIAPAVTTTCSVATQGSCDGGACVPPPPGGAALCLVTSGACPAGLAPRAPLSPITGDDRACACGCGVPPLGTCSGAGMTAYASNGCSGTSSTIPATGACVNPGAVGDIESLLVEAGQWTPDGACAPIDQHTGAMTFGAALTLCCAP